jgi:hypothetical protein
VVAAEVAPEVAPVVAGRAIVGSGVAGDIWSA